MSNLANEELCIGCTACKSVCPISCIYMEFGKMGFCFPHIDENKCIHCHCCEKVCPVLKENNNQHEKECQKLEVYAVISMEALVRKESSSGGFFSLAASKVIEDGGKVYGAEYTSDCSVVHMPVENLDELAKLRGAKYSQSDLKDIFVTIRKELNEGRKILFSGTPCQVAGLKNYLKKEYANLFCIDFVCHGVPLASVWNKYVEYRALKDDNGNLPESINLRSKHTGWSRYRYSNLYTYADGKQYSAYSSDDLYMKLFTGDYINQKGCSNCHFKGYSRVSDITLGDFWGIWDIAPEMDDDQGTSLVIIQSEKGKKMWEKILPLIKYKEVTLEEASRQNPSILYSSPAKPNRDEVIQLCLEGKWEEVEKMLPKPVKASKVSVLKAKLKHAVKKLIQ